MIKIVILWTNGTTAVFDEKGKQMPRYQGAWHNVKKKIMKDATKDLEVDFKIGKWGQKPYKTDRASFERLM